MVFSDGLSVGVKLDRNGLRPMRYLVTHDGLVIAVAKQAWLTWKNRASRNATASAPAK